MTAERSIAPTRPRGYCALLAASVAIVALAACLDQTLEAAGSTRVAFPLSDIDHPVVTLDLPGQQLRLLLNTGVPNTVIDARFRALLGPAKNSSATARAYTTHEHPRGNIGGIELGLDEVVCVDLGEMVAGEGVDGFLGMDFLRRHCLDFDWDEGTIAISQSAPEPGTGRSVRVDLSYNRDAIPQVTAKINGQSFQFAIDTGWIGPLTLSPRDERTAFPNGPARWVSEFGMTSRGILQSRMARAAELELAGAHSRDVLCSVHLPPQTSTKLGSYFLREFRAIFDFPHDRLTLVVRPHAPSGEADMSGIHLLRRRGRTIVYAVDEDSPASAAGVVGGDQIVAVDDEAAANLTPAQLRELLRSGDGERLALRLVHEGTERAIELTLRKRI
jgi:predicted aspartyl protease